MSKSPLGLENSLPSVMPNHHGITKHWDIFVNKILERLRGSSTRFENDICHFIETPPLRSRKEDIPMLASSFLNLASKKLNLSLPKLTRANIIELQGYDWPGNIRELQNVIERAVITSKSGKVSFDLSKGSKTRQTTAANPKQPDAKISILTEEEMKLRDQENILNALNQCNWKITGSDGAAEQLAIKPTTLHSKIKKMGLKRPG